ncbi:MAG: hypothetical protein H8M99_01260 [Gloeobacteraceae cyanobacterium ES-bin-144]|nr:hypothetical protein [Verrucomicrobiales bacterium]
MSEESAPSPENSRKTKSDGATPVRRISNPRIKKPAKLAPTEDVPAPLEKPEAKKTPKFPEFVEPQPSVEEPAPRSDWPEAEAPSSGSSSATENPKRKRRRKKGKGNSQQNAAPASEGDGSPGISETPEQSASQAPPQPQAARQNHPPRPKIDSELLARFAWKIFLSEVSEEGVALVNDNDAKELSRRCFRLAEIFLEEQARRR